MPRRARAIEGGYVYHVLNRANRRATIFAKDEDYAAFERVLEEAVDREPLRILGYCVMPNHWRLVVWPDADADRQVSEFVRWLTVTHTQRWRRPSTHFWQWAPVPRTIQVVSCPVGQAPLHGLAIRRTQSIAGGSCRVC